MTGPYYQRDVVTEANAAAEAALLDANSSTSITIPAVGDAVGPIDIGTGKEAPIDSTWKFSYTADASKNFNIRVILYSGSNVYGVCTVSNGEGSGPYDSWAAMHIGVSTTALALDEQEGLLLRGVDAIHTLEIMPGRIRDYSNTIDLVLTDSLYKNVNATFTHGDLQGGHVRVQGTGTISTSGTTVTGTGSNLSTIFDRGITADYQGWGFFDFAENVLFAGSLVTSGFVSNIYPVISTAAAAARIETEPASATSATTVGSLSASGVAYYRGGWAAQNPSSTVLYYGVVLMRRDSDGAVDVCFSSSRGDFVPDLPSGYTYYRVIGIVGVTEDSGFPNIAYIFNRSAVRNSQLAYAPAYTLKGRPYSTEGPPSDIDIAALTEKSSPASGDWLLLSDSAASGAFKKVDVGNVGGTSFPADMGLITESATTTFDLGTIV